MQVTSKTMMIKPNEKPLHCVARFKSSYNLSRALTELTKLYPDKEMYSPIVWDLPFKTNALFIELSWKENNGNYQYDRAEYDNIVKICKDNYCSSVIELDI